MVEVGAEAQIKVQDGVIQKAGNAVAAVVLKDLIRLLVKPQWDAVFMKA